MRALGVRGSGCEAYRWAGLRLNQPLHAEKTQTKSRQIEKAAESMVYRTVGLTKAKFELLR